MIDDLFNSAEGPASRLKRAAAVVVVRRAGGSKALENKAVAANAMHAQVWVAVLSFLGYLAWAQP